MAVWAQAMSNVKKKSFFIKLPLVINVMLLQRYGKIWLSQKKVVILQPKYKK